jgi:hypothetical protein
MLAQGIKRDDARRRIQKRIQEVLKEWGPEAGRRKSSST